MLADVSIQRVGAWECRQTYRLVADKDSGCLGMLADVSIIVDTGRWCLEI
jgi:hypothetical protein